MFCLRNVYLFSDYITDEKPEVDIYIPPPSSPSPPPQAGSPSGKRAGSGKKGKKQQQQQQAAEQEKLAQQALEQQQKEVTYIIIGVLFHSSSVLRTLVQRFENLFRVVHISSVSHFMKFWLTASGVM